jgi:hypothetical protein
MVGVAGRISHWRSGGTWGDGWASTIPLLYIDVFCSSLTYAKSGFGDHDDQAMFLCCFRCIPTHSEMSMDIYIMTSTKILFRNTFTGFTQFALTVYSQTLLEAYIYIRNGHHPYRPSSQVLSSLYFLDTAIE